MADEARVFAEGPENCIVRQFTVANATAIPKGTMLVSSGDRTGIAHSTANQRPLGYTTMSKTASDGRTTMGCQRTGVVAAVSDGSWTTGDILILSATANRLRALTATIYSGFTEYVLEWVRVGRALENATDGQTKKAALTLG